MDKSSPQVSLESIQFPSEKVPLNTHYIDGHFIQGQGTTFCSVNPCHQTILIETHIASSAEVQAAFQAAQFAQFSWCRTDLAKRIDWIKQFAQLLQKFQLELSQLIALETGKPLWEAKLEVNAVIQKVEISIDALHKRTPMEANIFTHGPSDTLQTTLNYKPLGVVAILGAFNFPAHLSNGHMIPALLAGNTVVYKPSEYTPLVAHFMMQAFHEIGLPKGVVNLIQGDGTSAQALIECPIKGVCFTGSYQTGSLIHQQLSSRPDVLLALEMGGNNPLVIDQSLPSDQLKAAVYHTMTSAYITSGQRCSAARRIIIPKSNLGDEFLEQLIQATNCIKVGEPFTNPEPFMGPVIDIKHAKHHIHMFNKLLDLGAKVYKPLSLLEENTAYLTPGLINMDDLNTEFDEELFAPCLQVYRYDSFDEAISIANNTSYGLSAGLFGDNIEHFKLFYATISAGLIHWNQPLTGASSKMPFGGTGSSGNYRPSAYFASDYVAYPVVSNHATSISMPNQLLPGITTG